MMHPRDAGMLLEVLGDPLGGGAVTGHAQVERLQALEELERVERGQGGAEIVHVLGLHERDEGGAGRAEPLDEAPARHAAVGLGQLRPARRLRSEVERAEVDHDTPE